MGAQADPAKAFDLQRKIGGGGVGPHCLLFDPGAVDAVSRPAGQRDRAKAEKQAAKDAAAE